MSENRRLMRQRSGRCVESHDAHHRLLIESLEDPAAGSIAARDTIGAGASEIPPAPGQPVSKLEATNDSLCTGDLDADRSAAVTCASWSRQAARVSITVGRPRRVEQSISAAHRAEEAKRESSLVFIETARIS